MTTATVSTVAAATTTATTAVATTTITTPTIMATLDTLPLPGIPWRFPTFLLKMMIPSPLYRRKVLSPPLGTQYSNFLPFG
eukprot:gene24727-biopygen8962